MIWVEDKQLMPCWKRSLFSVFVEKRVVNYLKTGQWTLLLVVLKASYGVVIHSPVVTWAIASSPKGIYYVWLDRFVSLLQHLHLGIKVIYYIGLHNDQHRRKKKLQAVKSLSAIRYTKDTTDTNNQKGQRLNTETHIRPIA